MQDRWESFTFSEGITNQKFQIVLFPSQLSRSLVFEEICSLLFISGPGIILGEKCSKTEVSVAVLTCSWTDSFKSRSISELYLTQRALALENFPYTTKILLVSMPLLDTKQKGHFCFSTILFHPFFRHLMQGLIATTVWGKLVGSPDSLVQEVVSPLLVAPPLTLSPPTIKKRKKTQHAYKIWKWYRHVGDVGWWHLGGGGCCFLNKTLLFEANLTIEFCLKTEVLPPDIPDFWVT